LWFKSKIMIIYFLEQNENGGLSFYQCLMKDRHQIWNKYPKAKEISKQLFLKLKELSEIKKP